MCSNEVGLNRDGCGLPGSEPQACVVGRRRSGRVESRRTRLLAGGTLVQRPQLFGGRIEFSILYLGWSGLTRAHFALRSGRGAGGGARAVEGSEPRPPALGNVPRGDDAP
eukprot:673520-Prorocentrum_minimum.AAC.1